ncbi:hypothetical protein MPTK1_5g17890 [Marchantia polymorpha subsp. ruderalis]|uniref:Uncharacterized protein n=2 Tax=Marchantia polymorpha TaxID=3197 RepID=A0AAF6BJH7_MARPO|nr:hypothetical protein MARPO_0084s0036 [Marchantia polymorpha]BBN12161.1 hypothetical protein Mp_5g17890 [Marchantia polymorpha subsp. ruderalis]|eukprot:PTQ33947.1 hypothetical protein MARPO_0084s0036 [Marchantia polymorpha]
MSPPEHGRASDLLFSLSLSLSVRESERTTGQRPRLKVSGHKVFPFFIGPESQTWIPEQQLVPLTASEWSSSAPAAAAFSASAVHPRRGRREQLEPPSLHGLPATLPSTLNYSCGNAGGSCCWPEFGPSGLDWSRMMVYLLVCIFHSIS